MFKVIVTLGCLAYAYAVNKSYTPIVMWNGMGGYAFTLNRIKIQLENEMPGVHVHLLKIGNSTFEESLNTFMMHPDKQIKIACNLIQNDPLLSNGYNSIGFSQGSQFLRALLQRCPTPPMKNYVSLGGQQQGVFGVPLCFPQIKFCHNLRLFLNELAYKSFIQKLIVQSTFWHNSLNEEEYIAGNTFLADINNEVEINQNYIDNLQKLENMILVKFEWDQMVIPTESQWFGFYKPNQSSEIIPVQELPVYSRLGLDKLDREGKIHFLSTPGFHLSFDWDWFLDNVIRVYFK